jgi:hypothetical protein
LHKQEEEMNTTTLTTAVTKPNRVRHSYTQSINATPNEVFPLLCPVREMDWAPGWHPDWVISESGVAEQDCIFQTSEDENTPAATWVITEHHPESRLVEMIKVIPGHSVMKLEAALEGDGKGGTRATISYGFTAIGPAGEKFVEGCDEEWYRKFMLDWEAAMNHYLATGRMAA